MVDDAPNKVNADDATVVQGDDMDRSPLSASAGQVLCGRYRLRALIGSGGMAQVWSATDTVLNRDVAIKMLHSHMAHDENLVARFKAEAIAAARLSHQNIVGVFDTCTDEGRVAIVMELLEARTLREHLNEHHTIEVVTTVRIALRVLAALEAAHRAGLVHRDIKPSNILLCDDGRVKIADFGIAKIDGNTDLTQAGGLMGTVAYLSPEQVADEPVDGRADLYALGIVIYECLTGTTPFKADTKPAMAVKRLHATPVDPRRIRAGIPPELARTIMRALERDPDDRFSSAADFRAALLTGSVPPSTAVSTPMDETGELPAPTTSFARSERRWLLPAFVLLLIATALVTIALLLTDSAKEFSQKPGTTAPVPVTPQSARLRISEAVPFDPQGDGSENNRSAAFAIDGDTSTAWKTEGYEPPGFSGKKSGVGLALELSARSTVDKVSLRASTNGWSARLFVLDRDALDDFDPSSADPVGQLEDVSGPETVELIGAKAARTGDVVLIWITNLGSSADDGRHRVEIASVELTGTPGA